MKKIYLGIVGGVIAILTVLLTIQVFDKPDYMNSINAIISMEYEELNLLYEIDDVKLSDLHIKILDDTRTPLDALIKGYNNFTVYMQSNSIENYLQVDNELIKMYEENGILTANYSGTLPKKIIIRDDKEVSLFLKPIIKEYINNNFHYYELGRIRINGVEVITEIADTSEKRRLGLMHRDYLPEMTGMLFILDREEEVSFWMMNMLIELDMIWIDSNGKIVHITEYAKPCKDDLNACTYKPDEPVKYVLEVNAGFSKKYNVKENNRVEILPY
ncbi:MAG: DUF192 domain-containing protein [Candidatus Nitrosocaldaceae archaeon]